MIITKKERNDFENAKSCHICNKEYKISIHGEMFLCRLNATKLLC